MRLFLTTPTMLMGYPLSFAIANDRPSGSCPGQ